MGSQAGRRRRVTPPPRAAARMMDSRAGTWVKGSEGQFWALQAITMLAFLKTRVTGWIGVV